MFDDAEHDDSGVTFRDLITLMLCGFVACVMLILPHVHKAATATAQGNEPPGNVLIEVRWPDEVDADVDLWVQGPGDVPVGYSNKGGRMFSLLRDDLGNLADVGKLNYETSYSRGVVAGQYAVNLHLYRNRSNGPVPAQVVVSVKHTTSQSAVQVLQANVELVREGQELTVFRFRLDANGVVEAGTVHNLPIQLRSGRKT